MSEALTYQDAIERAADEIKEGLLTHSGLDTRIEQHPLAETPSYWLTADGHRVGKRTGCFAGPEFFWRRMLLTTVRPVKKQPKKTDEKVN